MSAITIDQCEELSFTEFNAASRFEPRTRPEEAFHLDAPIVEISQLNGSASNVVRGRRIETAAPANDVPTRQSLLRRLRDSSDDESWRTFFETYWRLIYNVARKSGLSDDQAQEVVQETVIAVARKIPDFRYDPAKGSFKQWLLLICRRRIQDHLRRIYNSRLAPQFSDCHDLTEHAASDDALPDEEMERNLEVAWRENIFERALARVKQRANPKSFQVFDCVVLRNMAPSEVASMLGLNSAQVYLAKHRVSAAVKRAAKQIEQELSSREKVR